MSILFALVGFAFASYPTEIRDGFISGCKQSGGTHQYCECTIAKLETTLSYEEFEKGSTALQNRNPNAKFQRMLTSAASSCLTPSMYRKQFVPACVAQGQTERFCSCNLDHLVDVLGYDRLVDMSMELQMGKKPEAFASASENAAVKCATGPEYKKVFVKNCSSAGASESKCACIHDYFVKEIGLKKLIRLDSRLTNGKPAPEFDAITPAAQAACQ